MIIIPKFVRRTHTSWTTYSGLVSRSSCLRNSLRTLSTHPPDEEASFGIYNVILPEEPFVWGVSHITLRTVPSSIERPQYARMHPNDRPTSSPRSGRSQGLFKDSNRIRLGSEEETKLRASAKLARNVREFAGTLVRVSVVFKGRLMDSMVTRAAWGDHQRHRRSDSRFHHRPWCLPVSSTLLGVPAVVLHERQQRRRARHTRRVRCVYITLKRSSCGPSRPLEDGDIVNIDVTVYLDGFHGDTSETFLVGDVVRTPLLIGGTTTPTPVPTGPAGTRPRSDDPRSSRGWHPRLRT